MMAAVGVLWGRAAKDSGIAAGRGGASVRQMTAATGKRACGKPRMSKMASCKDNDADRSFF
ncbi:hypothetical protein X946_4154 [Burkholderia sp. ABCPW 111]|nr:hypothetical protein X946_4154 [Burkholderia sp. ABCPW 111]